MNWFLSWTIIVSIGLVHWIITTEFLWWLLVIIIWWTIVLGKHIFSNLQWRKILLGIIIGGGILTHAFLLKQSKATVELQADMPIVATVQAKYTHFYIVTSNKKKYYLNKTYYKDGQKQQLEIETDDQITLCFREKQNNKKQKQWLWNNFQVDKQLFLDTKKCQPQIRKSTNLLTKIKNWLLTNNSRMNQKWIKFLLFQETVGQFQEIKQQMQRMGIIHLFVISGFHLLILMRGWFWVIKKIQIGKSKIIFEIIGLVLGLMLVYFTSWKFSALKAWIFIGLNWGLAKMNGNSKNKSELLAIVGGGFLLINPFLFYRLDFQLSCFASWVLLNNAEEKTSNYKNRMIDVLQKSILVFFALLPIIINMQYEMSLFAVVYTWLYGLVTVILYPFLFLLIWWKDLWSWWTIFFRGLEASLIWIHSWDWIIVFGKWKITTLVVYYCLFSLTFIQIDNRLWKIFLILLWICNLIVLTFVNWRQEYYQLHFINVGHGLAMLLQGPQKTTNILLDAGMGKERVNNNNKIHRYLKKMGVNKLDAVFISHQHYDHYNNLTFLKRQLPIGQVVSNQKQIQKYHINELTFNNWAYDYYQEMEKENNRSLVLYTEISRYKLLFTFDLERKGEKKLIEQQKLKKIDILQVGHHGSGTSSGFMFLYWLKPKYCFISSNESKPKAWKNLEKIHCQTFNTKNNNNIVVTLGKQITIDST